MKPLPQSIQPKKWDKVFYYPDEPVVYNTPDYKHLFAADKIEIIDNVIERADEVFEKLFANRDGQIIIHGDLHYWNVHVHRGELYVMDFEDINLGYPVQDVAVTLYYGRQREGYLQWKNSFEKGYCSIRDWPVESEKTIETLMAARTVMFINYVARVNPSPQTYIEDRSEDLQQFLAKNG